MFPKIGKHPNQNAKSYETVLAVYSFFDKRMGFNLQLLESPL